MPHCLVGIEKLAPRCLQHTIKLGIARAELSRCKFLAQHRCHKSFDTALLREFVGEAVTAKDTVDVIAEFVSADLNIKL